MLCQHWALQNILLAPAGENRLCFRRTGNRAAKAAGPIPQCLEAEGNRAALGEIIKA